MNDEDDTMEVNSDTAASSYHGLVPNIMDPSLRHFLSQFGVLASATNTNTTDAPSFWTAQQHHSWRDIIFESSFDLTRERLEYVFRLLDSNKTGRISYEGLRKGLEMHASSTSGSNATNFRQDNVDHDSSTNNAHSLSSEAFDQLVQILDGDQSQDITLEEFSQGLRLLMLRALFPAAGAGNQVVEATIEVLDYDAHHLEQRLVQSDQDCEFKDNDESDDINTKKSKGDDNNEGTSSSFMVSRPPLSSSTISATDFYFTDRPKWVQTRWINVSGAESAVTLKRLAVQYNLHPLALEDALSPTQHRPKAEVYSDRKLLSLVCLDKNYVCCR